MYTGGTLSLAVAIRYACSEARHESEVYHVISFTKPRLASKPLSTKIEHIFEANR